MRFLHLLSILVALVLFVIQPVHATPYLELNFSGTFTDIADPYQRYNFDQGPFSGSIVLHGEGLLNETQNDYNAYYQFDRSYVNIVINGQEIAPLYLYYNLVRVTYSKSDDVWALAQAITVDQEDFRSGIVNQDLFILQYASQLIHFYDRTEEIADNDRGGITETRYDYQGTIGTVTAQQYELVQNPTPVPEPGTLLLLVSGLAVFALYHRRSMNK
jgi:hypothetical protein